MKRTLESDNHDVVTARDGQEALERFAENDFDLVFMDVQLPILDGVATTRAIRASGKPSASVPIIAMTAYAMSGDREKFLAAGMDAYLSKPMDMDELRKVIDAMLAGPGRPSERRLAEKQDASGYGETPPGR